MKHGGFFIPVLFNVYMHGLICAPIFGRGGGGIYIEGKLVYHLSYAGSAFHQQERKNC